MSQQRAIHSFFSSVPSNSSNMSASPVLPCSQLTQAQLERIQKHKEEALRRRAQMTPAEIESKSSTSSLGPAQQNCTTFSSCSIATSLVMIQCLHRSSTPTILKIQYHVYRHHLYIMISLIFHVLSCATATYSYMSRSIWMHAETILL